MVANNVQLRLAIWTYLLSSCCVTYAAELGLSDGLDTLTVKLISVSLGFSVLGGMASTIPKIIDPKVVVNNKAAVLFKDIVSSLFAGMVILFFCIWREIAWPLTYLLILFGGAGNAKIVDLAVNNRLAEAAMGVIERFIGAVNSAKDVAKDITKPTTERDLDDPKP